jgi:aldehyde dehydrogenase (NAD+)
LSFIYIFTENKVFAKQIIQTTFGGGCINDTVVHFQINVCLSGGVGHSGIGAYVIKFDTFHIKKNHCKKSKLAGFTNAICTYKRQISYQEIT